MAVKKKGLYKVLKHFRKSGRNTILRINLTEAEAQRVVKSYPDASGHMVIYRKQ